MPGESGLQKTTPVKSPKAVYVASSALGVWRPVGSGARPPGSGSAGIPTGSATGANTVRRMHSAFPVTSLLIKWGNFTVGSQEAHATLGDLTLGAASVEYPAGTFTPIFFAGALDAVIKPGAILTSDETAIVIPANTDFWIRTFVSWTAGVAIAAQDNRILNGQSAGWGTPATDKTQIAGAVGGDTIGPVPTQVLAFTPATTKALLVVGDSLADGTGDYPEQSRGYMAMACDSVVAAQKITAAGQRAMWEAPSSGRWRKARLAVGCTAAFEALGINDLSGSQTLVQLQANKLTLWQWLRSLPGIRNIYTNTIIPMTTSTDGWATATNQTPASFEANRVGYNNWVRDGAPVVSAANLTAAAVGTVGALRAGSPGHPLAGWVELADAVEVNAANALTRDGGRWFVPTLRTVTDAAITTGTKVLTSATAAFTTADQGKGAVIAGAGSSGNALVVTINIVTNGTSATVTSNASTSVTGASLTIGVPTMDGTHPSTTSHVLLSAALTAALPGLMA